MKQCYLQKLKNIDVKAGKISNKALCFHVILLFISAYTGAMKSLEG